jgi:hypothetical protein
MMRRRAGRSPKTDLSQPDLATMVTTSEQSEIVNVV